MIASGRIDMKWSEIRLDVFENQGKHLQKWNLLRVNSTLNLMPFKVYSICCFIFNTQRSGADVRSSIGGSRNARS